MQLCELLGAERLYTSAMVAALSFDIPLDRSLALDNLIH